MLAALTTLGERLPLVMIVLSVMAGVGRFVAGDLRSGLYWFGAALINYAAAGYRLPRLPWSP